MSDEVKPAGTVDSIGEATPTVGEIRAPEEFLPEKTKETEKEQANQGHELALRYKALALKFKAAYEGAQTQNAQRIAQLELACKNAAEKGVLASLLSDEGASSVSIACRVEVPMPDGTGTKWCLLGMLSEGASVTKGESSESASYISEWISESTLLERFPGFKDAVNAREMYVPPSALQPLKLRITELEDQARRIHNRTDRQLQQKDEEIRYLTDLVSKFSGLETQELPSSTVEERSIVANTGTAEKQGKGASDTPQSKLQARVQSATEFISSMSSGKLPLVGNVLSSGIKFGGKQQEVEIIKQQERKIADLAEKRRVMMQSMMNYQTETEELRSKVASLQAELEALKQEQLASPLIHSTISRPLEPQIGFSDENTNGKPAQGPADYECLKCKQGDSFREELAAQVAEAVQALKDEHERKYSELDGEYSAYRRRMVALVKEKESNVQELEQEKESLHAELEDLRKKHATKQATKPPALGIASSNMDPFSTGQNAGTTGSRPPLAVPSTPMRRVSSFGSSTGPATAPMTPGGTVLSNSPLPQDPALENAYIRSLLLRYLRETDMSVRQSLEMALAAVLQPSTAEHVAIQEARAKLYPGFGGGAGTGVGIGIGAVGSVVGESVGDALGKVTSGVVTGVSSLLGGWIGGGGGSATTASPSTSRQ